MNKLHFGLVKNGEVLLEIFYSKKLIIQRQTDTQSVVGLRNRFPQWQLTMMDYMLFR